MSSKDKDHEAPVDVRAIERSRKRGILSAKDQEKMLKHLPDVKGKSVALADVAPLFGRERPDAADSLDADDDDLDDEVADDEPAAAKAVAADADDDDDVDDDDDDEAADDDEPADDDAKA